MNLSLWSYGSLTKEFPEFHKKFLKKQELQKKSKPSKYSKENQKWLVNPLDTWFCPLECAQRIVLCPVCGQLGHTTWNLSQNNRVKFEGMILILDEKYVLHSHFIDDIDKGRHVSCLLDYRWINPDLTPDLVKQYHRVKNVPKWIYHNLREMEKE